MTDLKKKSMKIACIIFSVLMLISSLSTVIIAIATGGAA